MMTLNHIEVLESVSAPNIFFDFLRGFLNGVLGR